MPPVTFAIAPPASISNTVHPSIRLKVTMSARAARWCTMVVVTGFAAACGGSRRPAPQQVLDPPAMDLKQYGRLALMTFSVENAKGQLQTLSTEKFAEAVLAAQQPLELLELGTADTVIARAGETDFGPRSAKRVGDAHSVPVVFVGHLKVSDVKPTAKFQGLTVPKFEAKVTMQLSVKLVSATSGGTLWRASSTTTETIGKVGMSGGIPYFSADDPNDAYGAIVNYLVRQVTWDFRGTWRTIGAR